MIKLHSINSSVIMIIQNSGQTTIKNLVSKEMICCKTKRLIWAHMITVHR